jgi:hypothetical protein
MWKMKSRNKSSIYGTVWGARQFQALWPFAEGLFIFFKLFFGEKRNVK